MGDTRSDLDHMGSTYMMGDEKNQHIYEEEESPDNEREPVNSNFFD